MGLDMYLRAEKYFSTQRDVAEAGLVLTAAGMESWPQAEFGGVTVSKTVAYWRKVNAVHGWFVRELAKGKDECQKIYVDRSDLLRLRQACEAALHDGNEDITDDDPLRPTPGFFFGTYEKDEWYWDGLRDTVKQLDAVLTGVPDTVDLYYEASW